MRDNTDHRRAGKLHGERAQGSRHADEALIYRNAFGVRYVCSSGLKHSLVALAEGVALGLVRSHGPDAAHHGTGGAGRRMLGARPAAARHQPQHPALRVSLGLSAPSPIGLIVNLVTGVLLFIKNATTWGDGGSVSHQDVAGRCQRRDAGADSPLRAPQRRGNDEVGGNVRLLAVASILAWSGAVTAGRLLAYLVV